MTLMDMFTVFVLGWMISTKLRKSASGWGDLGDTVVNIYVITALAWAIIRIGFLP